MKPALFARAIMSISVILPTVERGLDDAAFCSMEIVGARPRIES